MTSSGHQKIMSKLVDLMGFIADLSLFLIAKLVNTSITICNTSIIMVFGPYIQPVNKLMGLYTNEHNWRAFPCKRKSSTLITMDLP
jgi:hypothetical protein